MTNLIVVREFLIHFFVGFGPCIALIIYCSNQGKRRKSFRFGGDSPLNFGTKTRWISWFTLAYIFEFVTSLHPGIGARIYIEMALSLYQACAATLGLFVADRLGMMFEPASYWVIENSKTNNVSKTSEAIEKIWIKQTVDNATQTVASSVRDASGTLMNTANSTVQSGQGIFRAMLDARQKKKLEATKEKEANETKERSRLNNLLRGY